VVDLETGKSIPITPEGVTGGLVSPDGLYILRPDESRAVAIYPIAGGAPRSVPNLEADFVPLQWSDDNSAVLGYRPGKIPTRVYKVNLITGQKTVVQELQPGTAAGVVSIAPVVVTRDGSRSAYSYYQVFSVLYLISGVR
jgi:hypothetical protein